jgi:hypothetical protein
MEYAANINGRKYQVKEMGEFTIQGVGELTPYGYSIECRFKIHPDSDKSWSTYWTNKIYNSEQSAINAILQMNDINKDMIFRIVPLYKSDVTNIREIKISELIGERKTKEEKIKEIIAWKSKHDFSIKNKNFKRGDIFVELDGNFIIKSGSTQSERIWKPDFYDFLRNTDVLDQIELKDEKWIYPHLLKEVKVKLNIN